MNRELLKDSDIVIEGPPGFPNITWGDMKEQAKDNNAARIKLQAENAELRAEVADYEASFDLYYESNMRAIQRYKDAHPDWPELSWPDKTDLTVWLLEQLEQIEDNNNAT